MPHANSTPGVRAALGKTQGEVSRLKGEASRSRATRDTLGIKGGERVTVKVQNVETGKTLKSRATIMEAVNFYGDMLNNLEKRIRKLEKAP